MKTINYITHDELPPCLQPIALQMVDGATGDNVDCVSDLRALFQDADTILGFKQEVPEAQDWDQDVEVLSAFLRVRELTLCLLPTKRPVKADPK